jgi:hypothetical protein
MLFLAAVAMCGAAHSVQVVKTVNAADDLVVAERVLHPSADVKKDASARMQSALDEVGRMGGGTVFLSAGEYTVAAPIRVPVGVTLRGDHCSQAHDPWPHRCSTVMRIMGSRGDENGPAAFTVFPGAGLRGLVFWYPEQTIRNPVPYPWTIRTAEKPPVANDNQTIDACTIVNAWRGIAIGPEWNELHTIRDVRICALKTGMSIDHTTDIGRLEDVHVLPDVWIHWHGWSGAERKSLLDWMLAHDTVGVDFGRSDWEFVRGLHVRHCRTGVRFRRGARGLTNAAMANCGITGCGTALELEALNEVGLAMYGCVLQGSENAVKFGPEFDSVVQFYGCGVDGRACGTDRFAVVRNVPVEVPSSPRRPPRPKGDALFDVAAFGASPKAYDNAGAFQRALDAAKGGGTVYVPAGFYRFRGDVRVPTGVEMRGASDVPHHTCSGGTVLMPLQGRGDDGGEPFVSLEEGAGLRGLSFWYPEQTTISPVPYPWTVRSLGRGCWLRDVNIGNGWQGVDFASNPSDDHFISYLSGCCWRRALQVGRSSKGGWVEDLQFNPHYALRRPHGLPVAKNPPRPEGRPPVAGWEAGWLREHLEGFVFRDCMGEKIVGTFLYAARDGIAFYGRNDVDLFIHGTDTGARGVVVDQAPSSRLGAALAQIVPFDSASSVEKAGIWLAPSDRGRSEFRASQFWVEKPTLVQRGKGGVTLDSFNSLSGPIHVHDGDVRIVAPRYMRRKDAYVERHGGRVQAGPLAVRQAQAR